MGTVARLNLNFKKRFLSQLALYFDFYFIIFLILIGIFILNKKEEYLSFYSIYSFLKNLINIKLVPLENDFIIFYTSTTLFFFILTIIFIPIILIYSFLNKEVPIFNTIYNLQVILILTIFGIIGIIYSLLLNNLKYLDIIYLTDAYLITIYYSIYILSILIIIISKLSIYYISPYMYIDYGEHNYLKEKDARIRRYVFFYLIMSFLILGIFLSSQIFVLGIKIPWYGIIIVFFNLYITFEIIKKRYFLNKETFYDNLYKLSKYFDKRFIIFFGILAFVAIIDTLNFYLINSYTIQNIFQSSEKIERSTFLYPSLSIVLSLPVNINILYFFFNLLICSRFYYLNYYLHRYILSGNISYKINKRANDIKNIQVNPMMTLISYLSLFIVFIINLML
jgi:hypothetical protein